MANTNDYGLPRTIPEPVKREVRQRCGFGCVICGYGFYDYEHFDPDFADATEHNPNGMTLLCPRCNQSRARGRLSRESVAKANADPICLRKGYANEMFDFHRDHLEVNFAGVRFYACTHLIVVNGRPILSVQPPKDDNSPMLLSGVFCDSIGRDSLTICENEWSVGTDNWDVECIGPRITIRSAPGKIALVLRMNAPVGVVIERLDMFFEGVGFRGNNNELYICMDGKNWSNFSGNNISHCFSGICIETRHQAANDPCFKV